MIVFLILLLAVISRLAPAMLHFSAANFNAVGGSLLFFGSRRSRSVSAAAVAVMLATDIFLTRFVYHSALSFSWVEASKILWYAGVCLLGASLLRRVSVLRVAGGAFASATSFWLLSDFAVWLGNMYPHTAAGLVACYQAAVPFFRNDLVSTLLVAGALFGLPVLATRLSEQSQGHAKAV